MKQDLEYLLEQLKNLCAIPSPSGYTKEVSAYLMREFSRLGYCPRLTRKGGVLVELGGAGDNALLLMAHTDTLGGMVAGVKENGRLKLTPVGGFQPNNGEAENCLILPRFGGRYTGTYQLNDASVHVNGDYARKERTFDSMEVVIDEPVFTAAETRALGIAEGDFVCFDPRTVVTESGYIKSRFLDDKLSVAILLCYARYLKQGGEAARHVYAHITVYEEVGHGAAGSVPEDVGEVLSVDMGCVGVGLACDERAVSICAKDSGGPYDYGVVTSLIRLAKERGLRYAVDVYPHYGSDAEAALSAGWDVRHGLIGAGVYASHGYERSHVEGAENTLELLKAYCAQPWSETEPGNQ